MKKSEGEERREGEEGEGFILSRILREEGELCGGD